MRSVVANTQLQPSVKLQIEFAKKSTKDLESWTPADLKDLKRSKVKVQDSRDHGPLCMHMPYGGSCSQQRWIHCRLMVIWGDDTVDFGRFAYRYFRWWTLAIFLLNLVVEFNSDTVRYYQEAVTWVNYDLCLKTDT